MTKQFGKIIFRGVSTAGDAAEGEIPGLFGQQLSQGEGTEQRPRRRVRLTARRSSCFLSSRNGRGEVNNVRDPRVERLHFRIACEEGTVYDNPAPLRFRHQFGTSETDGGALVVSPVDDFSNEADARAIIEPFLRAWEIATDIDEGVGVIRVRYVRADIVDRNPEPGSRASAVTTERQLRDIEEDTSIVVQKGRRLHRSESGIPSTVERGN